MQWKKNSGEVQATYNVKIAVEGLCKVLVTCIKETTGKGFHKVQAAWTVKASERGFHKCKSQAMQKIARAGNRKMKTTCILRKAI